MKPLSRATKPLSLRTLFPAAGLSGSRDIQVNSCCHQAEDCQPGDLYVAVVDEDGDGHDTIPLAIQRGASAVMLERRVLTTVPTCLVEDTRESLGVICHQLAGNPSESLFLAGVSGTSGKTATSQLLHSIWSQGTDPAGLMTNASYHDGQQRFESWHSLSGPAELAHSLSQMVQHGCQRAAVELSSQDLAFRHSAGLQLDAAILTRIRSEAGNLHGSQVNYVRAKRRLLSALTPDGVAIINMDDRCSCNILATLDRPSLTYSLYGDADVRATVLERQPSEQTFLLHAGNDTAVVHTRVVGDTHLSHCLAAAATSLVAGLPLAEIASGLSALVDIPGHLQRVECGQPFSVFVDSTNHPDTLSMRLNELGRLTSGRLICVYGPPRQAPPEQRARLGRVVERSSAVGIITSNNTGDNSQLEIAHDVLDGYQQASRGHIIPDRQDAICWALDQARSGDTVLLSGKGHRSFQVTSEAIEDFDDHLVASQWLYRRAGQQLYPDVKRASLFVPHDVN